MKRLKTARNVSVVRLLTTSMWTAIKIKYLLFRNKLYTVLRVAYY